MRMVFVLLVVALKKAKNICFDKLDIIIIN